MYVIQVDSVARPHLQKFQYAFWGWKGAFKTKKRVYLGCQCWIFRMLAWSDPNLINEEIATDRKQYEEKWTKSLAVGGKEFVENVKVELGSRANGRKIQKSDAAYQLREPARTYKTHLGAEKGNIDNKNAHIWNINDV